MWRLIKRVRTIGCTYRGRRSCRRRHWRLARRCPCRPQWPDPQWPQSPSSTSPPQRTCSSWNPPQHYSSSSSKWISSWYWNLSKWSDASRHSAKTSSKWSEDRVWLTGEEPFLWWRALQLQQPETNNKRSRRVLLERLIYPFVLWVVLGYSLCFLSLHKLHLWMKGRATLLMERQHCPLIFQALATCTLQSPKYNF